MPKMDLQERVGALGDAFGLSEHERAVLLRHFREACRDQRHACAEAVNAADYARTPGAPVDTAHSAVMNTPFPGRAE